MRFARLRLIAFSQVSSKRCGLLAGRTAHALALQVEITCAHSVLRQLTAFLGRQITGDTIEFFNVRPETVLRMIASTEEFTVRHASHVRIILRHDRQKEVNYAKVRVFDSWLRTSDLDVMRCASVVFR
jgi:hypothetical protein